MKYVEQIRLRRKMTVHQLVSEMKECGVLGAGRLGEAVSIMAEMFRNPDYVVFLTMAGPMIPGGLRRVIGLLLDRSYVNAVVASGANIVHDIIEGLGFKGIKGSLRADDVLLREKGLGRAGDIYFEREGFEALEKEMHRIFYQISLRGVKRISISELLREIGVSLSDEESILKRASDRGVPIFSPGILDSMVGLHLWTFNQLRKLEIDPLADLDRLSNIIFEAEKIGVLILGGGLPKHHVLGASALRDGVDSAVQITLDRPEGGSFSGAPLVEGISWRKVKAESRLVSVIGDATIIFPMMVAAALEELEQGV